MTDASPVPAGFTRIPGYERMNARPVPGNGPVTYCCVFRGDVIVIRDGIPYMDVGGAWKRLGDE